MTRATGGPFGNRRIRARAVAAAGVVAMGVAGAGGCGRSAQSPADAALEAPPSDGLAASDGSPQPVALDFSATGCASFDVANARCDGNAPLTIVFTPIASPDLSRFLWDFGDGSLPSSDRSPTHTYTLPSPVDSSTSSAKTSMQAGYDVTLVAAGSSGGTVSRTHVGYVNVAAAPLGAPCDVDQQCTTGLACVCGSASPCRPVLARGICTRPCDPAAADPTCPDNTSCADLSSPATANELASSTVQSEDWRRPLCLPVCKDDSVCTSGLACRQLLSPAPTAAWVSVCFATYPLGIGERCGDATAGNPIDADCASGLCTDFGAFGLCSADCSARGCPGGSQCAQLGDGRSLCLQACVGSLACSDDPLLACDAPGGAGSLGFSIGDPAADPLATYCAPKPCATDTDCGPAGTCPAAAAHCVRTAPTVAN